MFSRILVGTDGSETAKRAVARAVDLASGLEAELLIVTAHSGKEDQGRRVLDEAEKEHGAAVTLRTLLKQGHPADVLADVAQEEAVDLIVVGNKGMSGAGRFILGSVPNRVSHHAPSNVLIVRTT